MNKGSPHLTGTAAEFACSWTRREALRFGGLGLVALGGQTGGAVGDGLTPRPRPRAVGDDQSVILVAMVGGASSPETFDPRPDAPTTRRGPFKSIASTVPGIRLVEHLPRLAQRMDRLTLIRSLHHETDPTHAAGLQVLNSGSVDPLALTLGARVAAGLGVRGGMPPSVVLPRPVGFMGEAPRRTDSASYQMLAVEPFVVGGVPGAPGFDPNRLAGRLGRGVDRAAVSDLADWDAAPARVRARFGSSEFGRSCWLGSRLVEAGAQFVTIPMATTVFGQPSWDVHGRSPWSTWDDYAGTLLPSFDVGMAALLDHLAETGRLESTLVVATGEMGRTPWINESGGRDHWPGAWSGLVAGGGTAGARVLGATDDFGQIKDRPTPLSELVAMMAHHLGLHPIDDGPDGCDLAALLS